MILPKFYLNEVAKYPVVPHSDLLKLFADLERHEADAWVASGKRRRKDPLGKKIRELGRESPKVRAHLFLADRCVDAIVHSNMRLAVTIAARYHRQGKSLAPEDLVQEGALGLLRAIRAFEPQRGFRFSTYATWWIRHHVARAVSEQERLIRLPQRVVEIGRRVGRAQRQLGLELGRAPSDEELATHLKLDVARVKVVRDAIGAAIYPLFRPDDEDGLSWIDRLMSPDDDAVDLEGDIDREELVIRVLKIVSEMGYKHRRVLIWRFGLGDIRERTLKEIGDELGVSRERIRQVEVEALHKLRVALEATLIPDTHAEV